MRKITICAAVGLCLSGCAAEYAKIDDAKCQGYGAHPGDSAYATCRAQLDAARTQANAVMSSAPGPAPVQPVDIIPRR